MEGVRDIDYMISVMKAYKEGKEIQWSYNKEWVDIESPDWDWNNFYYRVKPDEAEPKYRPFKNTDELIAWWDSHYAKSKRPKHTLPLIWVADKKGHMCLVTTFYHNDIVSYVSPYADKHLGLDEFFGNWTFLDGKPCGVEEA